MTEFNPNCGRCGMLNSRGFCSLTACRYPSNVIAVQPTVIRGMMVNPQIEKPITNYERLISKTPEELAKYINEISNGDCPTVGDCPDGVRENETCTPWQCWLYWLNSPADKEGEG